MFSKLLIANRGEIAIRVIRAARELGVHTVAVYSEADRLAPHVRAADEAWLIGPAPSRDSYLHVDRILEAARRSGAEAIHPGYGFLAERAHFIRAVEEAGLVFVGPSAASVEEMGDKTAARRRMMAAGVPVVPGTVEPVGTLEKAMAAAAEIGYPVLVKASAGGGGKGMRIVRAPEELASALEAAANEARSSFGDEALYLEKYLIDPRHIEIQLLADRTGRTLHLGERECSIQRRHQKLIEESPSAALTPELRAAMGEAAVAAAKAVRYEGAGTIEFLFKDGEFFFLEMNTRIQVEHPVTEEVTGIDLVQWQLRIAAGESLPFDQADLGWNGHSIECRITAEDPFNGFLPSTGRIVELEIPGGPGVRWDGGIARDSEVGLHYDPMLAKLIVHAPTREMAIDRMTSALCALRIEGIETSIPFHLAVMKDPDFRVGAIDIGYLDRKLEGLIGRDPAEERWRIIALAAALLEDESRARRMPPAVEGAAAEMVSSAWKRASGWRGR